MTTPLLMPLDEAGEACIQAICEQFATMPMCAAAGALAAELGRLVKERPKRVLERLEREKGLL